MGNRQGWETRRFMQGEAVWVSPSVSSPWLSDDEAVVVEDVDAGYLVLQDSERVPSHGLGHFVCDRELSALCEGARPDMVRVKVQRLRAFSALTLNTLLPWQGQRRSARH
jgi:hypothetical protein